MRLCSGCQSKVPDNVRFCDDCRAERRQTTTEDIRSHEAHREDAYDAELDHLRKGTRWQSIRRTVLSIKPVCGRCNTALAEIADHIVPAKVAIRQARESGRWPHDPNAGYYLLSNLQGLCRPCHGAKTTEDKARTEPWPNVVEAHDAAPRKKWSF